MPTLRYAAGTPFGGRIKLDELVSRAVSPKRPTKGFYVSATHDRPWTARRAGWFSSRISLGLAHLTHRQTTINESRPEPVSG
jgi:hypothetical protein